MVEDARQTHAVVPQPAPARNAVLGVATLHYPNPREIAAGDRAPVISVKPAPSYPSFCVRVSPANLDSKISYTVPQEFYAL